MQIRLILLDFDGTLADTRRANTLAYVATLREAGYTLTEEEYAAKYFGMRCNEFLTRYGIADPAERERLRLRKIALYPAFFDTVRLNRPLWEFCRQFRAQGGRVWIVSTGSRANIDNAMRHLGITVAGQLTGSPAPAGCAGMDEAEMVGAGKGTTATGMDGAGVEGTGKGTAGADVDTTGAGNTAPGAAGSYTATAGTGAATPGAAWDPAPGEGRTAPWTASSRALTSSTANPPRTASWRPCAARAARRRKR